MNPAPIKPLISTSGLDKIDVRVGTMSRTWRIRRSSYGCVSISATTPAPFLAQPEKPVPNGTRAG
jgi:hypothetical protein